MFKVKNRINLLACAEKAATVLGLPVDVLENDLTKYFRDSCNYEEIVYSNKQLRDFEQSLCEHFIDEMMASPSGSARYGGE